MGTAGLSAQRDVDGVSGVPSQELGHSSRRRSQCATLLRDKLGLAVVSMPQVSGQPFKIADIIEAIRANYPGAAQAAE